MPPATFWTFRSCFTQAYRKLTQICQLRGTFVLRTGHGADPRLLNAEMLIRPSQVRWLR
jgi:hypothetical protein